MKTIGKLRPEQLQDIGKRKTRSQKKQTSNLPPPKDQPELSEVQIVHWEPKNLQEGMFGPEAIKFAEEMGKKSPHSGIESLEEYERVKDLKNRNSSLLLPSVDLKSQVIIEINDKSSLPPHPFKRTMVPVHSNMFKEAVDLVTEKILNTKDSKCLVAHLKCCDIFWIGPRPRQTTHIFNEKFRKLFDQRNRNKYKYDPHFLPHAFDVRLHELLKAKTSDLSKVVQQVRTKECDEYKSMASVRATMLSEDDFKKEVSTHGVDRLFNEKDEDKEEEDLG